MKHLKINIALLLAVVLWASAFIGIRVGLNEYSPGALALLRFLVASFCMMILYVWLPDRSQPVLRDKLALIFLGIAGIGIYNVCLNYGEMTVTASVASFIIGLIPIFSVILSVIFLNERPTKGVWIGILISMLGMYLIMKSETQASYLNSGMIMIFISAIMGAIHSVFQKDFLIKHHPITVTAWILWGGTLSMCMFSSALWHDLQQASFSTTFAAIYLGIFPAAIAYLAWSYVLEHLPVAKASLYLYAMPLISTFMGIIYLNETPSAFTLLGGLIALAGAVIAHFFHSYPETHARN